MRPEWWGKKVAIKTVSILEQVEEGKNDSYSDTFV